MSAMGQTMVQSSQFRDEERVGLLVALILHGALVALMAVQVLFADRPRTPPERMTVSLATEVSLESTAPEAVPESSIALAPELSDEIAPPVEEVPPQPQVQSTSSSSQPDRPTQTQTRTPRPQPTSTPTRGGGSRIGSDFLPGQGSSTRTEENRIPASQIGRSARASLQQAINRQLKRYWSAPQGPDAEQIVTVLAFRLNEDGSLAGSPRVVSQDGINETNRRQAPLHAERAIRAVRQAAPFDLPDEYYEAWKNITAWRFDRRL